MFVGPSGNIGKHYMENAGFAPILLANIMKRYETGGTDLAFFKKYDISSDPGGVTHIPKWYACSSQHLKNGP